MAGRPRGGDGSRGQKKAKTQAAQAAAPGESAHSSQMTDEQEHKLLTVHADAYVKALEAKKKADAALKAVCKLAQGEGILLDDMKLAIQLREPAGEEKLRADFERKLQIARWAGMAVGEQAALFPDVDRTPLVERAHAAGKRTGIEGKDSGSNPHDVNTEAGRSWEAGRVEGMAVQIRSGIKQTDTPQPGEATLIPANRPDASVVQSNDDEAEEPDEVETEDAEVGAIDDPTVDADVPYSERWKAANVKSNSGAHVGEDAPKVMAEPDF